MLRELSTLRFRVTLFPLVMLVLSACQEAIPAGPPVVVSDSAGVQIVEFDLDQLPASGTVDPRPTWVFGDQRIPDSGPPLNEVLDAKLFSGERVVVATAQPWEILLADPAAQDWALIADAGDGPGGVDFINSISVDGSIIGVHEGVRREWLTYSETEYLGAQRLPDIGVAGPFFPDIAFSDGNAFYVGDAYAPPGSQGGVVIRRDLLVARAEAGQVDTFAIVPGETGIDKFTGVSPQPFGPTFGMVASDSGLWLGDTAVPEVRLWTGDGQLRRIIRWRSSQDRTLTRKMLNALRDRYMEGRPSDARARIRRNFREMAFPEEIPAWGTLVVGSDGVLWIGEYPGPDVGRPWGPPFPEQRWWGIDLDGDPIGTVVTPPLLRTTDFATEFLIGIHRDSLGVETIRRHEVGATVIGPGGR